MRGGKPVRGEREVPKVLKERVGPLAEREGRFAGRSARFAREGEGSDSWVPHQVEELVVDFRPSRFGDEEARVLAEG